MKQIGKFLYISFAVFALTACDMFRIDNYEEPNAVLRGGIKDAVTGELVETDIQNGSRLQLQELGYPAGLLTRVVKQNGQYCDSLMFAGSYSIDFNACNFYPFFVDKIDVKKGDNVVDFSVTPYIRVKDVNIVKDGNSAIVATFKLQPGKPEVRLANVQLYFHTDIYVGDQVTTYELQGTGFRQTFNAPDNVIDESTVYTLRIDLTNATNKTYFKYDRNYYFRVGAMATVSGVGTIRRNYAPYQIIKFSLPQ